MVEELAQWPALMGSTTITPLASMLRCMFKRTLVYRQRRQKSGTRRGLLPTTRKPIWAYLDRVSDCTIA